MGGEEREGQILRDATTRNKNRESEAWRRETKALRVKREQEISMNEAENNSGREKGENQTERWIIVRTH